jgi:hypothetical protein
MPETSCRSCGSELAVIQVCRLCNQILKLACNTCGHISDEKVHLDCRKAEFLVTHRNN